jgi:hypothetical protein
MYLGTLMYLPFQIYYYISVRIVMRSTPDAAHVLTKRTLGQVHSRRHPHQPCTGRPSFSQQHASGCVPTFQQPAGKPLGWKKLKVPAVFKDDIWLRAYKNNSRRAVQGRSAQGCRGAWVGSHALAASAIKGRLCRGRVAGRQELHRHADAPCGGCQIGGRRPGRGRGFRDLSRGVLLGCAAHVSTMCTWALNICDALTVAGHKQLQ